MMHTQNTHEERLQLVKELIPTLNKDACRTVEKEVRHRILEIGESLKWRLEPGTRVIVDGGKRLKAEPGEIVKVNRTRCEVKIDNRQGIWNVPMNLINIAG